MSKDRKISLNLKLRGDGSLNRVFFNTFAIRKGVFQDFTMLDFAFVSERGILDRFSCITLTDTLEDQRDNFIKFAGGLNVEPQELEGMPLAKDNLKPEIVDIVGMARHGGQGEMSMYAFSWKAGLEMAKSASPTAGINADFIALLRCPIHVLTAWIMKLYADA